MIAPVDMQTKSQAENPLTPKPWTLFLSFPTMPLTDHLPSGDGLLAFRFIDYLANRGHRVYVATPKADLRNSLPHNVQLFEMNREADQPSPGALAYMRWTRKVLRKVCEGDRVDLIHELNPVFSLRSLAFAGTGIPVVLGPYSSRWPGPANASRVQRIARRLKIAVKDLIVSQQQKRATGILLSTPAALNNVRNPERMLGRMFTLPPGLDTEAFSPEGEASPEAPTVLFLANVCARKGVFELLDAFAWISSRLANARLIVAGGGDDLRQLKERVAASPFRDRVEFAGHVSREGVPGMMRRATVYCLPSHGEPFGISAIEAMACGKPLVVTRAGGPAFIVSDAGGKRVSVGDTHGLASALFELLSNPELCRSMGAYNRLEAERKYAWPVVGARLERIYARVLGLESVTDQDELTPADIEAYRSLQEEPSDFHALRPVSTVFDQPEQAYE
jgi:glycosyltransferase involved in cell wall biosynthesis